MDAVQIMKQCSAIAYSRII